MVRYLDVASKLVMFLSSTEIKDSAEALFCSCDWLPSPLPPFPLSPLPPLSEHRETGYLPPSFLLFLLSLSSKRIESSYRRKWIQIQLQQKSCSSLMILFRCLGISTSLSTSLQVKKLLGNDILLLSVPLKGPTGQIIDWPKTGIIGRLLASTYLAIDLHFYFLSLIFICSFKFCCAYWRNLTNYKCLRRSASISVSPNYNPNCVNAGTTAGFVFTDRLCALQSCRGRGTWRFGGFF